MQTVACRIMKNIYLKLLEMQQTGSQLVLATVTETIGSTPQKPGSSAVLENGILVSGTVGGGVVEKRVQECAKSCSESKRSSYLHLFLNNDISLKEEAICGGEIFVLIDANPIIHIPVFNEMQKSLNKREPGVLITMVTRYTEDQVLVNRYWMTGRSKPALPAGFMEKIEPQVKKIISSEDTSDFRQIELSLPGEEPASLFFLEPVFPMPRLIIAGAGHIGKALSHLGEMLDFDVTVIDDRNDYANKVNLPDAANIIVSDIGEAMNRIEKNSDTFIVIVTRGHNDDAGALKPCIGSEAAYVGMIGSKKKIARMHADFIEKKWASEEQWNRIFSPIGLDINSKTVEEIAVSIAAQLVKIRNSKNKP
jgi:xanthine dehydrogenase accessory factor